MDIFFIIVFFVFSGGFGLRLFRLADFRFDDNREKIIFSVLLGSGIFSYVVYFLGLLGFLYRGVILCIFAVLSIFSFREIIYFSRSLTKSAKSIFFDKHSVFEKILFVFIGTAVLFTLFGALTPPTGHDSLSYRLSHVRIFCETHRFSYIAYTRESLWPYFTETLYSMAMLIRSDISAKLIAWMFGMLSAGLVFVMGIRISGKKAGLIASAVFLMTPAFFNQITYSYVDIPFALFSIASLVCVIKFFRENDIKWALLGGVFCGFVMSIKYTGLIPAVALFSTAAVCFKWRREKFNSFLKGAAYFVGAAVLFSFSWYLRAYLVKGNPIYPFFARFFGDNGWGWGLESNIGSDFSILNFLKLPWSLTMFPDKFGGENFGVIFLLFFPLICFWTKYNKREDLILAVFTLIYSFLWFFADSEVNRFLFPAFFSLSVLLGCAVESFIGKKGLFFNFITGLLLCLLTFNSCLLLYYRRDSFKPVFGIISREQYLLENERTYGIAEYINNNTPENSTILMVNEIRSYYIKRPYIHLRNFLEEVPGLRKDVEKSLFLRDLQPYNIDYILYRKKKYNYPWMKELIRQKSPLYECVFVGNNGKRSEYYLYSLK